MTIPDRNSVFWWLYVATLGVAAAFIAYSFIEILVLGLFGYYATRPIRSRFERVIDSRRLAAGLTALSVLVPIFLLTFYAGLRMFQQIQRQLEGSVFSMLASRVAGIDVEENSLGALLRDPPSIDRLTEVFFGSAVEQGLQILDFLFGTALVLGLVVTLAYALLVYDSELSDGFAELVGGSDETVYSYALAVDTDLESIFFANLLFVLFMSAVATIAYTATNFVAPPDLQIPMVFTLGVLTGLTSLIPIIVSKLVYFPVVGYLAIATAQSGSNNFVFVGVVFVAYFLVLDILPQSFVMPYISGRQLNPLILLFAYILGPILFGWYGFFLLPIVFVLMLEAIRIVLPELLRGDPIKPEPGITDEIGAEAEEMQEDSDGTDTSDTDGGDPA